MEFFKKTGDKLDYTDILQVDGAFSVAHVNYDKLRIFNGVDGKSITNNSRKNSLSFKGKIENVIECLYSFYGTEKSFKNEARESLWKYYWLEYINAFNELVNSLPSSIVTISIGRQAIEIGFKYLLLKKNGKITKTHNLGELANLFFTEYKIQDSYMEYVDVFCENFCNYVEGGKVEYFRYPEYAENKYFSGNHLNIEWLSYNFAIIILKLIHFSNLDIEVLKEN